MMPKQADRSDEVYEEQCSFVLIIRVPTSRRHCLAGSLFKADGLNDGC